MLVCVETASARMARERAGVAASSNVLKRPGEVWQRVEAEKSSARVLQYVQDLGLQFW